MMVGYAEQHEGDCYRMYALESHYIYITRDVIWLKRMYYSSTKPTTPQHYLIEVLDMESEAGEKDQQINNNEASNPELEELSPQPISNTTTLRVTVEGEQVQPKTNKLNQDDGYQQVKTSSTDRKIIPR